MADLLNPKNIYAWSDWQIRDGEAVCMKIDSKQEYYHMLTSLIKPPTLNKKKNDANHIHVKWKRESGPAHTVLCAVTINGKKEMNSGLMRKKLREIGLNWA